MENKSNNNFLKISKIFLFNICKYIENYIKVVTNYFENENYLK